MGMLKEFREFAVKGNLFDIAIAFVMGAAFTRVVTALTQGLVSPVIGLLTGNKTLVNQVVTLKDEVPEVKDAAGNIVTEKIPAVVLKWGEFATAIIDFIIVAFVMFLIVKLVNSLKRKEEAKPAAPPAPSTTDQLLMEIRDALKK